jgi:hypothetical protein
MTEEQIRLKALEVAVERTKYGHFNGTTFQAVALFERYLKGEEALILDDVLSEWGREKWKDILEKTDPIAPSINEKPIKKNGLWEQFRGY